ncbi:hypothetical protein G5V59_01020 [Nocardioides sp. W3-2-3]|uniref:hypothetical protein n=1 Tax=Nocardioides convexus TaxID=2712224 RepID=UPI0024183C60|nr:hypothetical protein [Nocardioides convexus]NGZ99490.1 hypothetical protein [Nocardioides convexus]
MTGRAVRAALPALGLGIAYTLAILVGRSTRVDGGEISLAWPAAAVAVLWGLYASSLSRRAALAHWGVLGVLTFGVNLTTGASLSLATWFVGVNLAMAAVVTLVLRYGERPVALRDPADLGRLVVAVACGTLVAAALAVSYFALTGHEEPAADLRALRRPQRRGGAHRGRRGAAPAAGHLAPSGPHRRPGAGDRRLHRGRGLGLRPGLLVQPGAAPCVRGDGARDVGLPALLHHGRHRLPARRGLLDRVGHPARPRRAAGGDHPRAGAARPGDGGMPDPGRAHPRPLPRLAQRPDRPACGTSRCTTR